MRHANFLMGPLGEGSVVTVLKLDDRFTEVGSVVTWRRVLKSLRDTQWQRISPRLKSTPVLFCLRGLLSLVIFHANSHFFKRLGWVFYRHRLRSGSGPGASCWMASAPFQGPLLPC